MLQDGRQKKKKKKTLRSQILKKRKPKLRKLVPLALIKGKVKAKQSKKPTAAKTLSW